MGANGASAHPSRCCRCCYWRRLRTTRACVFGFADALASRLGNLSEVDVLPASAALNLPLETTPSEIASRLGVRFVVHGAIQMSKGQWRLSLEMVDTYLQRSCFTKSAILT